MHVASGAAGCGTRAARHRSTRHAGNALLLSAYLACKVRSSTRSNHHSFSTYAHSGDAVARTQSFGTRFLAPTALAATGSDTKSTPKPKPNSGGVIISYERRHRQAPASYPSK
eukprot:scaffold58590_cov71-Phaeocystis_antarctica.AAC.2